MITHDLEENEEIYQYQPLWNKWTIDGLIGTGSFGKVFRVSYQEYGHVYLSAVKIISIPSAVPGAAAPPVEGADEITLKSYFHEMVQSLINEVDILYSLSGNSNILGYHDHMIIEHKNKVGWDILIRMEYVKPLSQYLVEKQLTLEEIITLGIDICTALDICKKRGIIHRDIKDKNIFINDDGIFKLGDFGIAILAGGLNATMGGTPEYMAPEVYHHEKYHAAVDIYSLGIVMYKLLNHGRLPGMPPYPAKIQDSDGQSALAKRMTGDSFRAPDQAGEALAKVIMKACAYQPDKRYSSPQKMKTALSSVLKKLPEDARKHAVTMIPSDQKKNSAQPQTLYSPQRI